MKISNANKADLVLIKPGNPNLIYGALANELHAIEPPLWAILLAAYVREKGLTVAVIDAEAEGLTLEAVVEKIKSYTPRLTGLIISGSNLSASTWNMPAASAYAAAIKDSCPELPLFMWGLHPSALPEKTLQNERTDFVVQGEGFSAIVELLEQLALPSNNGTYVIKGLWYKKDGEVCSNPFPEVIKDLDTLPMAAWDLLPMDKYRAHNWHCFDAPDKRSPYAVVFASLGCPFDCHFCALKALFGKPQVRYRSAQNFVEEIDLLVKKYHVRNIKLLDECFVLNRKFVMEVCDLLISRNYDLNMWAYARIDTVDEELLAKLKKAGVNWLAYGIEAGSKKVRVGVAKGRFDQEKIYQVIAQTKAAGISVCGNFMFGLPDDDMDTMQETLDMAKELNCEYTNFYVTMAYPGSRLYYDAIQNNVKLPDTWGGYSQFSEETYPLPTKYLSPEQVLRFRDNAFNEFHSSEKFQKMIHDKYGPETVAHIKDMLKIKLTRKYI